MRDPWAAPSAPPWTGGRTLKTTWCHSGSSTVHRRSSGGLPMLPLSRDFEVQIMKQIERATRLSGRSC